MKQMLLSLIGISLLQCFLQFLLKEEQDHKILCLIGGAAMAALVISGLTGFDYDAYSSSLARERELGRWNEESVREEVNTLHRRYIEEQCAAYILEKASQHRIDLSDAVVTLAWNTDGYWYPVHAEMTVSACDADLSSLKRLIERDLGISSSEQIWRSG